MEATRKFFSVMRVLAWAGAAFLLALPAIGMRFFPEWGVDWSLGDFVVMGTMLLVACSLVEVGIRLARNNVSYFAGTVFAVGAGFVTVWVNLAVGMIRGEDNAQNLVFLGVILVALVGAFAARFRAAGMARAMLAAGIAQALVALAVAAFRLDELNVSMLIGAFALPWLLSAALFRQAAGGQAFAQTA
jgi:hypothetical protein